MLTVTLLLAAAGPALVVLASPVSAQAAHEDPPSESLVRIALKYLGVRYLWGGTTPRGFDCSGFVRYVYAKIGISIPHSVAGQYRYGSAILKDELEPGDLVFFDRLRHGGIYIGHGRFVHAARHGGGVSVSRLDEPWFRRRWIGGRRLGRTIASPTSAVR